MFKYMKQTFFSKLLLTSLLFLSQSMSGLQLHAITNSKNIQVTEAGKLSSLITSEEKKSNHSFICVRRY